MHFISMIPHKTYNTNKFQIVFHWAAQILSIYMYELFTEHKIKKETCNII